MSEQWFYLQEEEQVGPYNGEQLVELVTGNHIQRETLLWTEGMAEWLPAEQIENLFPPAEPVAVAEPIAVAAAPATATPYTPPGQALTGASQQAAGDYPKLFVKRANYMLYLTFAIIIPLISIPIGFLLGSQEDYIFIALAALFLGFISVFIGAILAYMNIYRAWKILQPGGAQATPGKAIGFLFIPFFNLYWVFIAYKGLAEDWNRIMGSYNNTKYVSKMGEGLFLTFCISLLVIQPLAPILMAVLQSHLCKGINSYLTAVATTNNSNQVSAGGAGLQLY